jgi:hypothetical protein
MYEDQNVSESNQLHEHSSFLGRDDAVSSNEPQDMAETKKDGKGNVQLVY